MTVNSNAAMVIRLLLRDFEKGMVWPEGGCGYLKLGH